MKKQLLTLAIVAAFASNAYASDTLETTPVTGNVVTAQNQAVDATPALNALDMQAAFQQDKQPMQVAMLSGQEMKATEGAWGWVPVFIAIRVVNTVWGATSGSARDRQASFLLGRALNYGICGNPVYCF